VLAKESPETSIVLMLRILYHRLATDVQASLIAAGYEDFSPVFGNVIPFVPDYGITVSALAQHVGVSKQAMGQLCERLERLGYVERHADATDRRARRLFLTPRGHAVRPVARDVSRMTEAHWAELVGEDAVESLRARLHELIGAMDAEVVAARGLQQEPAGRPATRGRRSTAASAVTT
jgi:DNA-binding MarR family transcriptional regulator